MRFKKNQRGQTYRSGWRSSAGGHWTYQSSDQSPGPVDAVRNINERGGKEIDQSGRRSVGEIGSWLEKPLFPTEKKFRKELTNPCDYWEERDQQQIQWQEELGGHAPGQRNSGTRRRFIAFMLKSSSFRWDNVCWKYSKINLPQEKKKMKPMT